MSKRSNCYLSFAELRARGKCLRTLEICTKTTFSSILCILLEKLDDQLRKNSVEVITNFLLSEEVFALKLTMRKVECKNEILRTRITEAMKQEHKDYEKLAYAILKN